MCAYLKERNPRTLPFLALPYDGSQRTVLQHASHPVLGFASSTMFGNPLRFVCLDKGLYEQGTRPSTTRTRLICLSPRVEQLIDDRRGIHLRGSIEQRLLTLMTTTMPHMQFIHHGSYVRYIKTIARIPWRRSRMRISQTASLSPRRVRAIEPPQPYDTYPHHASELSIRSTMKRA